MLAVLKDRAAFSPSDIQTLGGSFHGVIEAAFDGISG
jgi:hypothetical protein